MKRILLSFFLLASAFIGINAQTYVTFAVDMNNEEVTEAGVSIAGNFQIAAGGENDWTPGVIFLSDEDADGIYTYTAALDTGSYQYKFLNGAEWGTDEVTITEDCGFASGYDSFNRLLVVGEGDTEVTAAHVFNSCEVISEFTSIEDVNLENQLIAAPNPFSDRTQITYTTTDENVSLAVYNLVGQVVKVLVDNFHNAGEYTIDWDGTDESGSLVATGQYFYVLESETSVSTKRLLFVK